MPGPRRATALTLLALALLAFLALVPVAPAAVAAEPAGFTPDEAALLDWAVRYPVPGIQTPAGQRRLRAVLGANAP